MVDFFVVGVLCRMVRVVLKGYISFGIEYVGECGLGYIVGCCGLVYGGWEVLVCVLKGRVCGLVFGGVVG